MSLNAITWAFNQTDTEPTKRFILLVYANFANHDDEAWPETDTVVEMTGLSKSTIYHARSELCDTGKLTKLGRSKFRVNWRNGSTCSSEASETASPGTETASPGNALDKGTKGTHTAQPAAGAIERAQPQLLWAQYEIIVRGKSEDEVTDITPSIERTAKKALQEYPLEELITAIRGFMVWRSKKQGDMRFSSIFASHPGGRPLHDHIGFWIEQAGDASPLQGVTSEQRVKISRLVRDVQRGHGSRDAETVQRASKAMDELRELGVEMVPRESDGLPILRRPA